MLLNCLSKQLCALPSSFMASCRLSTLKFEKDSSSDNTPLVYGGYTNLRQAWVSNLDTVADSPSSIIDLHPQVFGSRPRIDIIHENVVWQRKYRYVSYAHTKVTAEVNMSGKKPWPQKGTGRARHGTRRSPLFRGGSVIHGPRTCTTHFYMLPFFKRVYGLTSTLSVKLAQDDLHVVKDLEIPTDDPSYINDLVESRLWGPSVLFIDDTDTMPRNIALALDNIKHINLMPVYGLNVYSMLKHETLVLTVAAVKKIQERLLYQLHRPDVCKLNKKFMLNQQN
ncbi:39S ribosomal protein L4, mitochondrial [Adelges cooleyi]|uniref:39S ribosomal protein L4, mitochondrial n=1 Tax=Adelges cooleyi TaxID=133065 RepID=UPI00217F6DC5|nr:39S ribosomal protein L4, mitochondrial [Adelges cooleyi]